MVLHLMVKNFGRIESADISLDHLVIFVGNNNSGKTMLMQLIYGIRKELKKFPVSVSGVKISDADGQYLIRCDQNWFREVELQINKYLADHKQRIMKDIFGTSVSAEEIQVRLEYEKNSYFVCSVSEFANQDEEGESFECSIDIRQYENGENTGSFKNRMTDWDGSVEAINKVIKNVWKIILSEKGTSDSGQLFLPASRSGLQLLYRYYFAEETKGSLVMPMRDFLRFLQIYSEDLSLDEQRKSLLEFGEEHLVAGKIVQRGDETFFVEGQEKREVPLFIASSMIHELAPFIKALSAVQRIDWLYCDEVENSLHPLLQGEMARWLIRMVNAGMHVVLSSHSDTMASRLNNLFMLARLDREKADYRMLTELGLMEADLLLPDRKASVYEFRNEREGKTSVEELEFISHPLMGYDFQLFGQNLDKLYDEADRITR